MHSLSTDPARARVAKRAFLGFAALVAAASIAVVARGAVSGPSWTSSAAVVAILGGIAVLLAWIAGRVHRTRLPCLPRGAIVLALAYHACFGPALMLTRAIEPVSRNDDLCMRLWPHVVHAINSFE